MSVDFIKNFQILKNRNWVLVDKLDSSTDYLKIVKPDDIPNLETDRSFLAPIQIETPIFELGKLDDRNDQIDPYIKKTKEIINDVSNRIENNNDDLSDPIENMTNDIKQSLEMIERQNINLRDNLKKVKYYDIRTSVTSSYQNVGLPIATELLNIKLFEKIIIKNKDQTLENIQRQRLSQNLPPSMFLNISSTSGKKAYDIGFFQGVILPLINKLETYKKDQIYSFDPTREWCGYPKDWIAGFCYLLQNPLSKDIKDSQEKDSLIRSTSAKTFYEILNMRDNVLNTNYFSFLDKIFEKFSKDVSQYRNWKRNKIIRGLIVENRFYKVVGSLTNELLPFKKSLDRDFYSEDDMNALGLLPVIPIKFGEEKEGESKFENVKNEFGVFVYRIVENIYFTSKKANAYAEILMQVENGYRLLYELAEQWGDVMIDLLVSYNKEICSEYWKNDINNMIQSFKLSKRIWQNMFYLGCFERNGKQSADNSFGLISGSMDLVSEVKPGSDFLRVQNGYKSVYKNANKILYCLGGFLDQDVMWIDMQQQRPGSESIFDWIFDQSFKSMIPKSPSSLSQNMFLENIGQLPKGFSKDYFKIMGKKDEALEQKSLESTSDFSTFKNTELPSSYGSTSSAQSLTTISVGQRYLKDITHNIIKDPSKFNDIVERFWNNLNNLKDGGKTPGPYKFLKIWNYNSKLEDPVLNRVLPWPCLFITKVYGPWILDQLIKTISEDKIYREQSLYFLKKLDGHIKKELPWKQIFTKKNEMEQKILDIKDYQFSKDGQKQLAKNIGKTFGENYEKMIDLWISVLMSLYENMLLLTTPAMKSKSGIEIKKDVNKKDGMILNCVYMSNWIFIYPKMVNDVYNKVSEDTETERERQSLIGDDFEESIFEKRLNYIVEKSYFDFARDEMKKIVDKKKKELKSLDLEILGDLIGYRKKVSEGDLRKIDVKVQSEDYQKRLKKMNPEYAKWFEKEIKTGMEIDKDISGISYKERGFFGSVLNKIKGFYSSESKMLDQRITEEQRKDLPFTSDSQVKQEEKMQQDRLNTLRLEVSQYSREVQNLFKQNEKNQKTIVDSISGKPPIPTEMGALMNIMPVNKSLQNLARMEKTIEPPSVFTQQGVPSMKNKLTVAERIDTVLESKESKINIDKFREIFKERTQGQIIYMPLMEYANESIESNPIKFLFMNITKAVMTDNLKFGDLLVEKNEANMDSISFSLIVCGQSVLKGNPANWRIIPFHYLKELPNRRRHH